MRSMQRTYGNRFAQSALGIKRECACGGACPRCQSNQPQLQPSATVEEESQARIARSEAGLRPPANASVPANSTGAPLDHHTRGRMESSFGHDFSSVRVHTGPAANHAAAALDANAFTAGRDVYFAAGKYNASSSDGMRLLAHELTHTVQQASVGAVSASQSLPVSSPGDPDELEADRMAETVAGGGSSAVAPAGGDPAIHRQPAPDALQNAPAPGRLSALRPPGPLQPAAPAPGDSTIKFETVTLSTDPAFDRFQLESMTAWAGLKETQGFVTRLMYSSVLDDVNLAALAQYRENVAAYGPPPAPDAQPGAGRGAGDWWGGQSTTRPPVPSYLEAETRHRAANKSRLMAVIQTVFREFTLISADVKEFLAEFEKVANDKMYEALGESQARVEGEAHRYGISPGELFSGPELHTTIGTVRSPADVVREGNVQRLDAARWSAAAGERKKMIAAAVEIKRRKVWIHDLEEQLHSARNPSGPYFVPRPRSPLDFEREARARDRLDAAKHAFDEFLHKQEVEFPILAAFAHDDGDLSKLTDAKGADVKAVILDQVNDKLRNIYETRDNMRSGKITPWTIPFVVEGTKRFMKIEKGSMINRVVDDYYAQKKEEIEDKKAWWKAISILSLALGLLALIPTPLSPFLAAGSAILGAAVAYHDLQDYMVESAASGTDFDKARAISQEDPSLFWLAVELVGTVLDLGAAVKGFRTVSGLRRAVIAGEEGAAAALATEAGKFGPGVAERAVREAEAAREAVMTQARAGHLAAVIEEDAVKAGKLAEDTFEHGGHLYQILKDGRVIRCSKWCTELSLLFGDLFQRHPHLAEELKALRKLKGKAAVQAAAELGERMQQVRKVEEMTIEELTKALEEDPALAKGTQAGEDARYIKYQKEGGTYGFNDWVAAHDPIFGGGIDEDLSTWGLERQQAARDQLRANMERIRAARPPVGEYQAHHIIPYQLRNHPLIQRLRLMFGWDINEVVNGVLLPTREAGTIGGRIARHLGSHSEYTLRIEQRLWDIEEQLQSGLITDGEALADVGRLQDEVRASFVRDYTGARVR